MSWADADDLLVGDIPLHAVDVNKYLGAAEDEMYAWLGQIYELPLPSAESLPQYQSTLLRLIHARLTSGRLIMSMALGGEQQDLHAYGNSLVNEALTQLRTIGTTIQITGATATTGAGNEDRTPSVVDTRPSRLRTVESAFDTYEGFVHGVDAADYVSYENLS